MDFGWNIFIFEEKNMKFKVYLEFFKNCLEENIILKGFIINKLLNVGVEDEIFCIKWNGILRNCLL